MFWPGSKLSTKKISESSLVLSSQETLQSEALEQGQAPLGQEEQSRSESAAADYENVSQKFLALINSLREIGADALAELPSVVVAGNQSAGKSSLLERISGVRLPRGDGTCTRCVIDIRLNGGA